MDVEFERQLRNAFVAGINKGIDHYHSGTPIDANRDFDEYIEQVLDNEAPNIGRVEGYEDLSNVLNRAFEQAAFGKGDERHAGGKPFKDQPIMTIQRAVGHGHGYARGQAMKKTEEAGVLLKFSGKKPAVAELLGAIVYLSAAVLYIEE